MSDDRDGLTHLSAPGPDDAVWAACGTNNWTALVSGGPEFCAKVVDCPACRQAGHLDHAH